jgi:hypothetical protein
MNVSGVHDTNNDAVTRKYSMESSSFWTCLFVVVYYFAFVKPYTNNLPHQSKYQTRLLPPLLPCTRYGTCSSGAGFLFFIVFLLFFRVDLSLYAAEPRVSTWVHSDVSRRNAVNCGQDQSTPEPHIHHPTRLLALATPVTVKTNKFLLL